MEKQKGKTSKDLSVLNFQHIEDRQYFEDLLEELHQLEDIDPLKLFDFRPPVLKRKEFNNMRSKLLKELLDLHGQVCMLKTDVCELSSGIVVDHIIPLSSNKLNKELRNLKAEPGKKVLTQSFGSNDIANLIIACSRCNNHKKHRLLIKDKILQIFKQKMSSI